MSVRTTSLSDSYEEQYHKAVEKILDLACALEASRREQELYQQARKQKSEFLSIISHELRTPVTILRALTQIFLKKAIAWGDQETIQQFMLMERQINKLRFLIQDLLDISAITEGIFVLHKDKPSVVSFTLRPEQRLKDD